MFVISQSLSTSNYPLKLKMFIAQVPSPNAMCPLKEREHFVEDQPNIELGIHSYVSFMKHHFTTSTPTICFLLYFVKMYALFLCAWQKLPISENRWSIKCSRPPRVFWCAPLRFPMTSQINPNLNKLSTTITSH